MHERKSLGNHFRYSLLTFAFFSAALALLNAVPCYTLDGQWIFSAMMEFIAIVFKIDPSDKESIKVVVLSFGTLLLVANVCVAFNNSILHLGG